MTTDCRVNIYASFYHFPVHGIVNLSSPVELLTRLLEPLGNRHGITSTFLSLVLALAGIAGCAGKPATQPQPSTPTTAAPPSPPTISRSQLYALLDRADAAIAREHLTFPTEGSAYAIYQQILARQKDQEDALRGLEHIVEKYIELALGALSRQQFAAARSMLARAHLILPNHPSIEPTEQQIRLLQQAQRLSVTLDAPILKDKSKLAKKLLAVADVSQVSELDCRFKIWAASDAQGRRIYKILTEQSASNNPKLGEQGSEEDQIAPRLRAQMGIRYPAAVERTCF